MSNQSTATCLRVTFDLEGKVIKAENSDGSSVDYDPTQKFDMTGARLASHYQPGDLAPPSNIPPSPGSQNIIVEFGADGAALKAMNEDGTPVALMSGQKVVMENAHLRSQDAMTGQACCWRLVNGQWLCRPEYC